jgi:YIF1
MAFITYVLIISFVMGTAYEFTPAVLASTASTGLAVTIFEVVTLKFGFYLLNAFTVPVLDIAAYSGYKYVGATITVVMALLLGPAAFWGFALFAGVMTAVFMRNTLRLAFPESQGCFPVFFFQFFFSFFLSSLTFVLSLSIDAYSTSGGTSNRKYFLLAVSILQLLIMLYLAYSSHLM